jgi:hypothetical protein
VRDDENVALLMSGLPHNINLVTNDKVLTFLHRLKKIFLKNIEILILLVKKTFQKLGLRITDKNINVIANMTCGCGYPYLIQLLGYYIVNENKKIISPKIIKESLLKTKAELFQNVHEIIFRDISNERSTVFI